jgi:hypothetical protein
MKRDERLQIRRVGVVVREAEGESKEVEGFSGFWGKHLHVENFCWFEFEAASSFDGSLTFRLPPSTLKLLQIHRKWSKHH